MMRYDSDRDMKYDQSGDRLYKYLFHNSYRTSSETWMCSDADRAWRAQELNGHIGSEAGRLIGMTRTPALMRYNWNKMMTVCGCGLRLHVGEGHSRGRWGMMWFKVV